MKTKLGLILISAALAFPALSAEKKKKAPAPKSTYDLVVAGTQKLAKLDFKKKADYPKGEDIVLDTIPQFEKFEKVSAKDQQRIPLFEAFVAFAREGGPFDGESQLTGFLSDWTSQHKELKTSFEAQLGKFPAATKVEKCKTERLKHAVEEASCLAAAGLASGNDPADAKMETKAKACVPAFNFESCLK